MVCLFTRESEKNEEQRSESESDTKVLLLGLC